MEMTLDEAIKHAEGIAIEQENFYNPDGYECITKSHQKCAAEHRQLAEWLKDYKRLKEQEPVNKLAMMYEIYMEGVNMSGEYQGCWVRFKDIEKIVDKYIGGEV